ncbi:ser/Thr protein phosphatase-like protein family [Sporormia fimetaria CBS 119925]|uniref:Ser/Thr protein phosphatase-like protein family n=1 Tax=Sporormia fimetaria CBS 119925 TaxID=1340428 RepID=A0A6A6V7S5_9PLEO|nr:ser/Thr protein phosphatase-like protein family [Sporormia fimetaria CBS 119925]
MMKIALTGLAFLGPALCAQPSAPSPIPAPLRPLPWGQLNFLHTTDIHGWWGGHLQEPSYSADWGDYISFAKHLRDRADAEGRDLLLIDTGDRIEGNAIYDSSKPRGKFTYEIAKEQHIDLICSGNHELYKQESADGEFYHTVPDFSPNYIASNLDIYNPKTARLEALAPRFKKFTTENQGIRILAFGFLFDFTGNANNTVIHKVKDTVQEGWFQHAIQDKELDLIVVIGHVDVRSDEYATLYATIRAAQPDIPIQFFGGHRHIRDYRIFDDKSVAIASGRYMETIGFMSINGLNTRSSSHHPRKSQEPKPTFSRLYIDNNLYSLHHHSAKNLTTFPTPNGLNVTTQINSARHSLHLNRLYGCAPRDLWVNRAPYPHPSSIFSWLSDSMLPDTVKTSSRVQESGKSAIAIINTGGIRFDIFKGAFTKDTAFLVSPFTSRLRYVKDVPSQVAVRVLPLLNHGEPMMKEQGIDLAPPEVVARKLRRQFFPELLRPAFSKLESNAQAQLALSATEHHNLIPGYTTHDDAGTDGDDTIHSPIDFFEVPNCIQAVVSQGDSKSDLAEDASLPTHIDIVYNEFIEKWVLMALRYLGESYKLEDTEEYFPGKSFTQLMVEWVEKYWGVDGEECE